MHPVEITFFVVISALIIGGAALGLDRVNQAHTFERRHHAIVTGIHATLGALCHRFGGPAAIPARLDYNPAACATPPPTFPANENNLACHPDTMDPTIELHGAALSVTFIPGSAARIVIDTSAATPPARAMANYFASRHGWQPAGNTVTVTADHTVAIGESPHSLLFYATGTDHNCARPIRPAPTDHYNANVIQWPDFTVPGGPADRPAALTDTLLDTCDPITTRPCFNTANVAGSTDRCHPVVLPASCTP